MTNNQKLNQLVQEIKEMNEIINSRMEWTPSVQSMQIEYDRLVAELNRLKKHITHENGKEEYDYLSLL